MTTARLGLKVKVIDQDQRSMTNAYGRGNAVMRSMTVFFSFLWRQISYVNCNVCFSANHNNIVMITYFTVKN